MLIDMATGRVTLMNDEGIMVDLPYEPLSERDMRLQAAYHLLLRRLGYRRTLVCRECQSEMVSDNQANEDDQSWEVLTRCACRAIYGKMPLSRLPSPTTH